MHAEEGLSSFKQIETDLNNNNTSEEESDGPKQYLVQPLVFSYRA